VLQPNSFAASLHHIPDDVLRDSLPPHLARTGNRTKHFPLRHTRCVGPLVEGRLNPSGNGHSSNVPALADQVHHRPVPLSNLDFAQFQTDEF